MSRKCESCQGNVIQDEKLISLRRTLWEDDVVVNGKDAKQHE